jgi:E-phenylitaconyl-CoA hydratase
MTALVGYARDGAVAVVTLQRPERLNTLNADLLAELRSAWERARDDEDVRLLRPDEGLALFKPVVAAVNGHALGGGLTLMLATDVRVSVPEATFGVPETGWGLLASAGGTQRLARQLPHAIAMDMLLCGTRLSAEEALRWGLVNRLVERERLLEAALEIAQRMAAQAPLATQATKELVLRAPDMPTDVALRLEATLVRLLQDTDDAHEGAAAWAQRRAPRYRGR